MQDRSARGWKLVEIDYFLNKSIHHISYRAKQKRERLHGCLITNYITKTEF